MGTFVSKHQDGFYLCSSTVLSQGSQPTSCGVQDGSCSPAPLNFFFFPHGLMSVPLLLKSCSATESG